MSNSFNQIFFEYIEEQAETGRREKQLVQFSEEEQREAAIDHVMCDVQSQERQEEEYAE